MSVSDNAERGVKLLARHNDDTFAGVPIKKRRFPWVQSPSPPPSCTQSLPVNNSDVSANGPSVLEPEPSCLDVGSQIFNSGDAALKDSSWDFRAEPLVDRNVNLALDNERSPGFNQGFMFMFMFSANASTGVCNGREPILENRSAMRPTMGKPEFRSMLKEPELSLGEGGAGRKLVLSEKSAFQRVLGSNELPLASRRPPGLSMGSQNWVGSYIEQEKMDPCSLGLALAEGQYVQSKSGDTKSSSGTANVLANRSHWDLNTAMDSWERSFCDASLNHQAGSKDSLDVGNVHYTKLVTWPVGQAHQESSVTHAMQVKRELVEGDYHLKLPNPAILSSKQSDTETDLTLQVKTAFGSSHFNLGLSCASAEVSSHKEVSDLSLSVKPMTPSYNLNLAVAQTVKAGPMEEGNVKDPKSVEVSNLESVNNRIVKSEPCEGSIQEGPTVTCFNSVKLAHSSAVKSEQVEVPSQGDLRITEGRAQYSEPDTQTLKLPFSWDMHRVVVENATGASNLVSQALIDGNKVHYSTEIPLAVDTQSITHQSSSKISESVVEADRKILELVVEPGVKISELTVEPGGKVSELAVDANGKVSELAAEPGNKISESVMKPGNKIPELVGQSGSKFSESVGEPSSNISESVVEPCSKNTELIVEQCGKISESVVEPLVPDCSKLDSVQVMPMNADTPTIASQITDKAENVVSESVVPDVNNSPNCEGMAIGANIPQSGDGLVYSIKGANEVVGKASGLPPEAIFSDSKEPKVVNALPEIGGKLSSSEDHALKSSRFSSVDESHIDPYGNSMVAITNEKGEASESCEHKYKPGGSHDVVGEIETVSKQRGDDDDYEDGEVRDLLLHGVMEGSCEESEPIHVHVNEAADAIVPMQVPDTMPSHLDGNESMVQNPDESKDVHCTLGSNSLSCGENNDAGLSTETDVQERQAIEMSASASGKKKLNKVIRKVPQDQLAKEKGLEAKPSNKTISARHAKATENSKGVRGNKQVKGSGNNSLPGDRTVISKTELTVNLDANKSLTNRVEQSRVIHLNSISSTSSSGRTKPNSSRSISPRIEKERLKDKSFMGEKPRLKSVRDDGHPDGLYKSKEYRNCSQRPGKPGSDFTCVQGRVDLQSYTSHGRRVDVQSYTSHGNRDPDNGYPSENFNSSTDFHVHRHKNASERSSVVGMDGSFGSVGRTVRKHTDNELRNFCLLQSRRRSSGGREGPAQVGVEVVRRTMRDLSPGRCSEGVPDLRMHTSEEKLLRGLVDDMVDPSLFAHSRPRYEPVENCLSRRERRSLSPFQRRGAPHFPQICLTSSPRPRAQSPRLWSPSRRSPNGFEGHPDLTSCRSPPVLRVERMRSPRQHACFPEGMMDRRHASPPYVPRLHDEMRDVGPLRDHDLTRPSRHLQRNIRRFDLVDPRVNAEEEYFGRLHDDGQFYEPQRGNECADVRNSDERQGLVHSFRHRYNVDSTDGNVKAFNHHIGDVPPRPIRFCPEVDEQFPDRRMLREMSKGDRDMEVQEEDYRHDGGQGWRGASFKDDRLKRRRF